MRRPSKQKRRGLSSFKNRPDGVTGGRRCVSVTNMVTGQFGSASPAIDLFSIRTAAAVPLRGKRRWRVWWPWPAQSLSVPNKLVDGPVPGSPIIPVVLMSLNRGFHLSFSETHLFPLGQESWVRIPSLFELHRLLAVALK